MRRGVSLIAAMPALLAVLAACQSLPATSPAAEREALALAQGACGGCQAVETYELSPNSEAPSFAEIANRQGLTRATLERWLSDAHNYPEDMDFHLGPAEVDALVRHILTLSDPAFRPPPS